jgi:hypothetical protein
MYICIYVNICIYIYIIYIYLYIYIYIYHISKLTHPKVRSISISTALFHRQRWVEHRAPGHRGPPGATGGLGPIMVGEDFLDLSTWHPTWFYMYSSQLYNPIMTKTEFDGISNDIFVYLENIMKENVGLYLQDPMNRNWLWILDGIIIIFWAGKMFQQLNVLVVWRTILFWD